MSATNGSTSGAPRGSRAWLALAVGLSGAALLFAGVLLGRRQALQVFRAEISSWRRAETLGAIAGDERATFAQAYLDPAAAERDMDGYTWTVPTLPMPFVGSMPAPGVHASATISGQQFRHAPLALPKPAGVVRIFLTGGSTAFGTGAPSDATTIDAFLQARLQAELAPETGRTYEVVNAATPAWTSTHERILIENRLSELEPDVVISLTGNNEAHYAFSGMNVLWMRTYADVHFERLLSRIYAAAGPGPLAQPDPPGTGEPVAPAEVLRRLSKNVRLAHAALDEVGATYVLALQPSLAATAKALSPRERAHLASERLGPGSAAYFASVYAVYRAELAHLARPGLLVVDLSGVFDELTAKDEVFLDSYHFGDRGNRLLADALFEELAPLLRARD